MEAASSSVEAAALAAHTPTLTDPAGGGMQVDEEPEDLENKQVTESGRKRWKENNVAKEMLTRCAEEAASTATLEMKEASIKATMDMKDMTSRLMQDAADRDQHLAERDQRVSRKGGWKKPWNPMTEKIGLSVGAPHPGGGPERR